MSRRTRRRSRGRSLPGWLWLLTGLAIGLFVALIVFLQGRSEEPGPRREARVEPAPKARAVQPEPEAPPATRPRFDFYTILPELEVLVPEPEPPPSAPDAPPPPVERPGTYVLQAGSFKSFQEADRLKAQLALIGVESHIQTVTVDGDTWHRVRVGPFERLDRLNAIRGRLREHDVQTMLLQLNS